MQARKYEFEGEMYTTAEIAEKLGIKKHTMAKRLRKNGYDLSKCLSKPPSHRFKDLTGRTFVRWTVDSRAPNDRNANTMWNCVCECGSKAVVAGGSLVSGTSESCGCLVRDKNTIHGHARKKNCTGSYMTYKSMIQRCTNPSATGYESYGGRGVTVCDRWLDSFENFLEDMGERPVGMSLDRIDTNSNYDKANCRWATQSEQTRNSRQSRRWFLYGKEYMTASEAAKALGITKSTVRARCNGYTDRGKYYPPKEGCYSKLVYSGGA